MQSKSPIVKAVGALALLVGLSLTAQAQIGSGWTSTSVSYST